MSTDVRPPRRLRIARWLMLMTAALLIGVALLMVAQYATEAASGTHLFFSQEEMMRAEPDFGPAPAPGEGPGLPDEAVYSSTLYVDVRTVVILLALGLIAAVGVIGTRRRGRWALIAAALGGGATLFVAAYPVWAAVELARMYRMPFTDLLPVLAVAALPLAAGLVVVWGLVTGRGWLQTDRSASDA